MAKNKPYGDGHRRGAVKNRSQVYNDKVDRWTKRNLENGEFMDQKQDGDPFKGLEKRKTNSRERALPFPLCVCLSETKKRSLILTKEVIR